MTVLRFFPKLDDLKLDIVGFLAILGEGSVQANAQVSTLSKFSFLPRVLPAPQALLRPSRPSELEPTRGLVTAVKSGNHKLNINHVGHILVDSDSMPDFAVRCIQIVRLRDASVKAKRSGPLSAVAILGCLCSIGLLAISIHFSDGMALLATLFLSFLSTLIGLGNYWTLQLPRRPAKGAPVPTGDLVIRYFRGAFIIVKCNEDVARELFFAPENVNYLISHPPVYRLISLIGTLMLMCGVILLGNARTESQIAFAAAYMLMNVAHWAVAALPAKLHWDTSCFEVRQQRIEGPITGTKKIVSVNKTYTQALWKAILVTKSIDWVKRNNAAPETPAWDQWLDIALNIALSVGSYEDEKESSDKIVTWKMPDWDPQQAFCEILQNANRNVEGQ